MSLWHRRHTGPIHRVRPGDRSTRRWPGASEAAGAEPAMRKQALMTGARIVKVAASNKLPGSREQTDRALLERVVARDRDAFRELYVAYHRRLARFLMRLTRRYEVAEEIINDTFWIVWRKASQFRGESLVSTWI